MGRDITHSLATGGGRSLGLGGLAYWLAIGLGGALLLTLLFARAVGAAGEGISVNNGEDLMVTEGTPITYKVVLTGDPAPTSDVTVTITSSNDDVVVDTDTDTTGSQTTLTFTSTNYRKAQFVHVTADDADADNENARLTHAVAGGGAAYDAIADAVLRVVVTDDDEAAITFSTGTGDDAFDPRTKALEATEDGDAVAPYTVVLKTEPSQEVTVAITSDNDDVTVAPATLTFDADNYTVPQSVQATVAADLSTDDESATLTHKITSGDSSYAALGDQTVMIAITDDDQADLTFTDVNDAPLTAELEVEENTEGEYKVALAAQPTADVTVTIRSDNEAVYVRVGANVAGNARSIQLTFTKDNYSTAQSVAVVANRDSDSVSEKVTLSHAVSSSDANFNTQAIINAKIKALGDNPTAEAIATERKSLNVAVEAVDTSPGIRLAPDMLMLVDAADAADDVLTGEYTITLQAAPTGTVTVTPVRSDKDDANDEVTVTPATLTFATGDLGPKTFTVTLTADADTAAEDRITISHTLESDATTGDMDAAYEKLSPRVQVTFTDNDPAGVTFAGFTGSVAVDEGGTGTYTVVLDAPPTAAVRVTITSGNSDVTVDTDADTDGNQNTLTFVAANPGDDEAAWDDPQTVTVAAAADADNMSEEATLSHAVSSSDAKFNTQRLKAAAVAALADDATDAQKAAAQNVLNVMVDVADTSVGVRLSEDELMLSEGGTAGTYDVVLQSVPAHDVIVTIRSDNADVTFTGTATGTLSAGTIDGVSVADAVLTLTFTPTNSATAQTVTVAIGDDTGVDDESATLRHSVVSDDPRYDLIEVDSVAVAVADTTRALLLTPDDLDEVVEGQSASFTVMLSEGPVPTTESVTVTVTSSDATVLAVDGADTAGELDLTFTDKNFEMPQTVTLMAKDNNVDAPTNATATITLAAAGGAYVAGTEDKTLTITVLDDDITGVVLGSLAPVMEGSSESFTVQLATPPTMGVTVTITSDDTDVVTVNGADATTGELNLMFVAANPDGAEVLWNNPQTVTVTAVEDNDSDDANTSLMIKVTSDDPAYGGRTARQPVFVSDDDASPTDPGKDVVVSKDLVALVEGSNANFTVRLSAAPEANVTVAVSSSDAAAVTVTPASLTFTPTSYAAQTVTVEAVENAEMGHRDDVSISLAVTSTDTAYEGRDKTVDIFVADNDPVVQEIEVPGAGVAGLVIDPLAALVEGGRDSFTVGLNTMPTADVTVAISSNSDLLEIGGAAADTGILTLTFTSQNYGAQTVNVMAGQDEDTDHNRPVITLDISSTDTAYMNLPSRTFEVFVADDDPVTVTRTRTRTVTQTVTRTVTVPAPAPAPAPMAPPMAPSMMVGSTGLATATEVNGQVVITRMDPGPTLTLAIGGFIRDETLGQTYQVVRRADGMIVRRWVSPNSPLVYQIDWAVVNSTFTVPVGVIGSIPLDDTVGSPGQLVRRFDGGDDRIFSYEMGQWRHVPNIPTFQALGFYWCDVTAADADFFNRITIGAPHPATDMAARDDYPSCSTG